MSPFDLNEFCGIDFSTHEIYVYFVSFLNNQYYIDGLMQTRRNSITNALELNIFYIKPSISNPSRGSQQPI